MGNPGFTTEAVKVRNKAFVTKRLLTELVVIIMFALLCCGAEGLGGQGGKERLRQARSKLTGRHKQIQQGRRILLDLAEHHRSELSSTDLCYVYVYLGYIEDWAENREEAVRWFKKAAHLDGAHIEGIRKVAETGVKRPVRWIKHLDKDTEPPWVKRDGWDNNEGVVERIGEAVVLRNEPVDVGKPDMNLSEAQRLENFELLVKAIDHNYSFFEHKDIDWERIAGTYRRRIKQTRSSPDFYHLIQQLVRELKDFHCWLCNCSDGPELGRFHPQIATGLIEGMAVVTDVEAGCFAYEKGLRRGAVIVRIDGRSIERTVRMMEGRMRVYSSRRAFLEQAYRRILDGDKGSFVEVSFILPGGRGAETVRLQRVTSEKIDRIRPSFPVHKGEFVWYGKDPSGCGYLRICSFEGCMEISDEFDRALEKLRDTSGFIIDVRDNPGGYGTAQAHIVGRFLKRRTKVGTSYVKSGAGHDDFRRQDCWFGPAGEWQYTKPTALLVNAVTGSACDLFVSRMISSGRPVTIGGVTHGNLTGRCVYVKLPCKLVVRISSGYICDGKGRVIETNGNTPDIQVRTTVEDIIAESDPVIRRAVAELQERQ